MISRPIGAASRMTTQSIWNRRTSRQTLRCRSVKNSGEKCQIASFGQISRRPPPAKPQPIAKGRAIHSPAMIGGMPTIDADDGAGVGPGEQAGEERAGQRQVRGVVVEQQPRQRRRRSAAGRGWRRRPAARASPASRSAGSAGTTGNRTSIVARTATTASFDHQRRQQELLGATGAWFRAALVLVLTARNCVNIAFCVSWPPRPAGRTFPFRPRL